MTKGIELPGKPGRWEPVEWEAQNDLISAQNRIRPTVFICGEEIAAYRRLPDPKPMPTICEGMTLIDRYGRKAIVTKVYSPIESIANDSWKFRIFQPDSGRFDRCNANFAWEILDYDGETIWKREE